MTFNASPLLIWKCCHSVKILGTTEISYSKSLKLNLIYLVQLEQLLLNATDTAKGIKNDALLAQLYHFIQNGRPESS